MKNNITKMLLKLASSDSTTKELHEFASWIRSREPEEFVSVVKKIREQAKSLSSSDINYLDNSFKKYKSEKNNKDEIILRIENILRNELNLTLKQSSDMLIPIIQKTKLYNNKYLAPKQGESYVRWISRLRKDIPDSELLHFVTILRNDLVNNPSDWPLKGNK